MNNSLNLKRLIGLGIGTIMVVFITNIAINILSTSTITIDGSGAEIYVQQDSSSFKELGKGSAEYKTRSTSPVYIEIRKGDQTTQKAVQPLRRNTVKVLLELKPLATIKEIGAGPIKDPYVEGGFIYGINPNTNSLTARPLSGNTSPSPSLPILSYLRKIIWVNSKNFLYITLGRGAGVVDEAVHDSHSPERYIDAAKPPNSSTTGLLSFEGLFLMQNLDIDKAVKVLSIPSNASPSIFADQDHFYVAGLVFEELNTDEEGHDPPAKETTITVLDLAGKEQRHITLPLTEAVSAIAGLGDGNIAVMSRAGLYLIDKDGKSQTKTFSFGRVDDFMVVNSRLLLLSSAGLWEYDLAQDTSYKLANYPAGEEYAAGTLTLLRGTLHFSSIANKQELRKPDSSARNRVYSVDLSAGQ